MTSTMSGHRSRLPRARSRLKRTSTKAGQWLTTALRLPDCDTFALRKVGSLRLLAEAEALERSDRRTADTLAPSWEIAQVERLEPQAAPERPPEKDNKRYSEVLTSIVSDYVDCRDRAVDDPAEQKKIAKDVSQQRAILAQFVEATQV